MRTSLWLFIFVVAAADVEFTWLCRSSIGEWEANPAAVWIFGHTGVTGVICYRGLWLGFAALVAASRTRLSRLVTPVWTAGHVYLLMELVRVYPYAVALQGGASW